MADSTKKVPLTAPVTILGRTMIVQRPNETQLTLMHRHGMITSKALERAVKMQETAEEIEDEAARTAAEELASPYFAKGLTSAAEILDIIEYLVSEDDREFLEEQMKRGKLGFEELFGFFDAFKEAKKSAPKKAQRVR